MKSLLLPSVALFAFITPTIVAAPRPPAVYGGFEVGKKFTFTVNTRSSASNSGAGLVNPAPIPKGVPNLAVGQQVTFTIGKKGELKAPKINLAFLSDGGTSNSYMGKVKAGNISSATVGKNPTTGEPTGIALYYVVNKVSRTGITSSQVTYTLNP